MSEAELPPSSDQRPPVQRVMLWGLLTAVLLAVVVTATLGRQWARPAGDQGLPVLVELPAFELLDQSGSVRTHEDLAGLPWIADFIFTRCGGACPRLTSQMIRFGKTVDRLGVVRRVSISVDPTYDRPEVLRQYAESYQISDPSWLFLTGEHDPVYDLVLNGFKLAVDDNPPAELRRPNEPIVHSSRFVLVDGQNRIRGYYDAFQSADLERLARDLESLL